MTLIIDSPSPFAPREEWERFLEQAEAWLLEHPDNADLKREIAEAKAHLKALP